MDQRPLVTFVVPCYNSEGYLAHCLESLVGPAAAPGSRDALVEVIVVDDGSTDGTLALARTWEKGHPGCVRVVHQENAGHGAAINAAVPLARGIWTKVVDSDDWLDSPALDAVIDELGRRHATGDARDECDLLFANYVYEHLSDNTQRVVDYRDQFPQGTTFAWDDVRPFPKWKFLMMHSFIARTAFLREEGIRLPEHMSYDDEVLVYQVLPRARRLAYLDCDLYRYATGRPGQSVGDESLARHASDQVRVCRLRIDTVRLPDDAPAPALERYLLQDLGFSMVFATLACTMAGDAAHLAEKDELWEHLREVDPVLWRRVRFGFFGFWCFLPGRLGKRAFLDGYHLASYAYKLN